MSVQTAHNMAAPSAAISPLPNDYTRLVVEVASLLGARPDELSAEGSLLDVGLDSLRLMTLVERLRASGAPAAFVDFAEEPTLGFLARKLGLEPA